MTRRLLRGWWRQTWHTGIGTLNGCRAVTEYRPTGAIARLTCTCGRLFYLRED